MNQSGLLQLLKQPKIDATKGFNQQKHTAFLMSHPS